VVAALPGLRDVHLWEVAAANLCDAVGRFPLGCCRRSGVGVAGLGAGNRLRKRKRRLRRGRQGHKQGGKEDWNDEVSLALEGLDDVSCANGRGLPGGTACAKESLCQGILQITGAILRNLSLAGHARAVESLDHQSGEARTLCGGTTKPCRASGGSIGVPTSVPKPGPTGIIRQPTPNQVPNERDVDGLPLDDDERRPPSYGPTTAVVR
jgi:hypothetical protein